MILLQGSIYENNIHSTQFLDGPAEDGEMFMRPGKLADYFPRLYCQRCV